MPAVKRIKIVPGLMAIPLCFVVFAGAALAQNGNGVPLGEPFQELQNQIDDLQALILALQLGNSVPIALTVDCVAGETITAALDSAVDSDAPLTITVLGTCEESVLIRRDDVTVVGGEPNAGLKSVGAGFTMINGTSRILIDSLKIDNSNGAWAMACFSHSQAVARNVTITGGFRGIFAEGGGNCRIRDSVITGSTFGAMSDSSGNVEVRSTEISSTAIGVISFSGGTATVATGSVLSSNGTGAFISSNASLFFWGGVTIKDSSGDGIVSITGGALRVEDDITVDNNGGNGIRLDKLAGMDFVNAGADLTNNGGSGISCDADTSVNVFNSSITFGGNGAVDNDGCSI